MRRIFFGLLGLLIFIKPVSAGEPPTLLNPVNNTTVSSSKLEWKAPTYPLYTTKPYNILVDDDPSFTSINKDYDTNNTYYTPILDSGTWYWRVRTKNSNGTWSNWSDAWSFILAASAPLSTPSTTPTISTTPSPTSAPSPTTKSSSFIISNIPSQISSDQSFNTSITLSSPNNQNTKFYLKGTFKKSGSSNYFGLTKVFGNWVKNNSIYSDQFPVTTDSTGSWSGNLGGKPDNDDSGFTGTGDYIFKVGKYNFTDANPSVSWSNEITIKINNTSNSSSTETPKSNPKISPSTSPLSTLSKSSTSKPKPSSLIKSSYQIASVAGTTTSAASSKPETEVQVKSQRQVSPFVWVGLIFILIGTSLVGYIYIKKNAKINIKF